MTTSRQAASSYETGFFLKGSFQTSGKTIDIRSPYDSQLVGVTFEPDDQQVEAAVHEAVAVFSQMAKLPSFRRAEILRRIAEGIDARREEFIRTMALEAGKPRKACAVEVDRATFNFRAAAEEAVRMGGELLPLDLMSSTKKRWGIVRRFPVGPVLAITPFNFPLNLVGHKVAPAFAAGCTIVVKPAPQTPLCALLLAEAVQEAGAPAGAFAVLPCSNAQAETMVRDERFRLLSFTGSGTVGWKLKSIAGRKRVALELGGNAGVIVHSDANLELAAERCTQGGFSYAGQTCISVQRILVHRSVEKKFTELLVDRVKALVVGDPLDPATDVGPLISLAAAERVDDWVADAISGGARALCGRRRRDSLFDPTVLANTNPDMLVNCEEVFGPVVTVSPYDSFDEALVHLNDSRFGLQAGVFTRDIGNIFRAYEQMEVGGLMINEVPTFRVDTMPYGGSKESGIGREGPRYAIEEMTEPRLLMLNLDA
ncbi:MAG TPA: aldehyde dehydrogenase family protein [Patescibacteria group bacterium]|nr:aldehyde dehydrogenase family protein [Patescibacteria group bacterium]